MLKFIATEQALPENPSLGDYIDRLDTKISSPVLRNMVDTLNRHYSRIRCSEHTSATATIGISYMGLGKGQLNFTLHDCCCSTFKAKLEEMIADIRERNQ
ncbi:hypothetical protein [Chitinophaga solisilvae]|nr:hypothetical protein [Chitinophaga solisilvae]